MNKTVRNILPATTEYMLSSANFSLPFLPSSEQFNATDFDDYFFMILEISRL
jgi:hypothetical protein